MQRLSLMGALVFTGLLTSLSGCANRNVEQQANGLEKVERSTATPTPNPMSTADENFAKQWKAEFDKMRRDIIEARDSWEQNNIRSYSFVAAKDIGGVSSHWNRSPVLITVDNGRAVAIEVVDKNDISSLARTDGFEEFDTIDKMFDYMLRELENGQMVKADYEKKLGYPKFVSFMFSYANHGARSIAISKLIRAE